LEKEQIRQIKEPSVRVISKFIKELVALGREGITKIRVHKVTAKCRLDFGDALD
jgi:hypothetical protein